MWHRSKAVLARRMRALCVVHRARGGVDRNIDSCETCLRQQVDPLRRQQRAIRDQDRDHADLRSMSDDRRKIPMHERLTAGKVQKPNAVVNQDVGSELCLIEGHGMSRRRGQPVAGKAAEIAACLQALVMAKWHSPGPPSQTACSAIFRIEGRLVVPRFMVRLQSCRRTMFAEKPTGL
jgi:hypothetical protein